MILCGKQQFPMLQKKNCRALELAIACILKLMVSHKYVVFLKER
jgi:hypothetical protein